MASVDAWLLTRFWAKVPIKGIGCWLWTGCRTPKGYGQIRLTKTGPTRPKIIAAHRLSYNVHVGEIPAGLEIDHICRNRLCVNPAHLRTVTRRDNVINSDGPSAQNLRKTSCRKGHAFDRVDKRGHRICMTCNRETRRAYKRRRRAERNG